MRIYTSQASKRHYWKEDSRQHQQFRVDEQNASFRLSDRGNSVADPAHKTADTNSQVEKFYKKYGEDWLERYRQNERGVCE